MAQRHRDFSRYPGKDVSASQDHAEADIWLEDPLERPTPALVTLVTLNPGLQHVGIGDIRFGTSCTSYGTRLNLEWGPAPLREHSSLLDTYLSDPPCKRVYVGLTVNFRDRAIMFPIVIWVDCVVARTYSWGHLTSSAQCQGLEMLKDDSQSSVLLDDQGLYTRGSS
jgi:hypothetical protein